jgi:hypothetical protein
MNNFSFSSLFFVLAIASALPSPNGNSVHKSSAKLIPRTTYVTNMTVGNQQINYGDLQPYNALSISGLSSVCVSGSTSCDDTIPLTWTVPVVTQADQPPQPYTVSVTVTGTYPDDTTRQNLIHAIQSASTQNYQASSITLDCGPSIRGNMVCQSEAGITIGTSLC